MYLTSVRARLLSGEWQDAVPLANEMLQHFPGSGDAAYALFIAKLASGQADMTIFKQAVAGRSADWVVRMLRDDLPGLCQDDPQWRARMGKFFRSLLPILDAGRHKAGDQADQGYVNAVGTSIIRTFGSNPIYFPLFIGMGNTLIGVTEQSATQMVEKYIENIRRLDLTRPLLVAAGVEPFVHVTNYPPFCVSFPKPDDGTPLGEVALRPQDIALMQTCAVRYRPILAEIRRLMPNGSVTMLCSTPTLYRNVNVLAQHFNAHLRVLCGQYDIPFLDVSPRLTDPVTNLFRQEYSAGAFEGDHHINSAGLAIITEELCRMGFLPEEAKSLPDYAWSNVFNFSVVCSEVTRIWCEPEVSPNNALRSPKIACSFIGEGALDLFVVESLRRAADSLLLFNVRDGFIPVNLPRPLKGECVSVSLTERDYLSARRVLAFAGRFDVLPIRPERIIEAPSNAAFDGALAMIYPNSLESDVESAKAFFAKVDMKWLFVAAPENADPSWVEDSGMGLRETLSLGNSHIHPDWRGFSIRFYEKDNG